MNVARRKKTSNFCWNGKGGRQKINPIRNEFKLSKTKSEFVYFFRMIIAQQQQQQHIAMKTIWSRELKKNESNENSIESRVKSYTHREKSLKWIWNSETELLIKNKNKLQNNNNKDSIEFCNFGMQNKMIGYFWQFCFVQNWNSWKLKFVILYKRKFDK